VRSGSFRAWLDRTGYETLGALPTADARGKILSVLEGVARFEASPRNVRVRLAEHDAEPGAVYFDLGGPGRDAVRVVEEAALLRDFDALAPGILGALLDGVTSALAEGRHEVSALRGRNSRGWRISPAGCPRRSRRRPREVRPDARRDDCGASRTTGRHAQSA
jgi:hypothetical protein